MTWACSFLGEQDWIQMPPAEILGRMEIKEDDYGKLMRMQNTGRAPSVRAV